MFSVESVMCVRVCLCVWEKITQLTFGVCVVLRVAKHESWKWNGRNEFLWLSLLLFFVALHSFFFFL